MAPLSEELRWGSRMLWTIPVLSILSRRANGLFAPPSRAENWGIRGAEEIMVVVVGGRLREEDKMVVV